jgi:acyl-CoA dehydrogenase
MDTDFSPEQEALRAELRRFLAERAPVAWVRERWDDPAGTDRAVWRGLCELGLAGLLVPEAAGGAGLGMVDAGVVLEELGRALHPGPWLASAVGAVSAATALGASDLLAALGSGERIATLALREPGRSFASWREPATRADAGRLTGTKCHVASAADADLLLVGAGDGVFAVETAAPGVEIVPERQIDGTRRFARVRLSDAPARRLGPLAALDPTVDRLAVALALDGLGAAQAVFELALEHARRREQFGRPIGAFQAVSHLCTDMFQTVELGRSGARYALWAADHAEPAERHRAAVLAMAWAADRYPAVAGTAIQIFGGAGFSWEMDVHLYHKRLLSLEQELDGSDAWYEKLARIVC